MLHPSLRGALLGMALSIAASAAPVQWTAASGGNDNWYEFVPAVSIFSPVSFDTARSAALGSLHLGLTGYLATVTSAAEQAFIQTLSGWLIGFGGTGSAFLGASDAAVEGEFRWLDGPEAGQLLTYTNWSPGRPAAQFPTDDFLHLYINAQTVPASFSWVDSGNTAFGYVVEYGDGIPDQSDPGNGAIPEPSTWLLTAGGLAIAAARLRKRS